MVPLNEPFCRAPILVMAPMVMVPLALEAAPGVFTWKALTVAPPAVAPEAFVVPEVGAEIFAYTLLNALACVVPCAVPVSVTPAVDCVPTVDRLASETLPTVPPLPTGIPKNEPAGLMALAAWLDEAVPACAAPAVEEPCPKPEAFVVVLPFVTVPPVAPAW